MKNIRIDAKNLYYKELNEKIYNFVYKENSVEEIIVENVCGQRYIAAGIKKQIKININGVPGNDLGVFMDGVEIFVDGNAQDGVGNTMNSGKIIVNGCCGDVVGYGMRGGCIYIKDNAGYRVGIHMKAYEENFPVIVVGGSVGDFLGEYMAGGIIIILGLNKQTLPVGNFAGTGMHGGSIFIRSKELKSCILGKEVRIEEVSQKDYEIISKYIKEFCKYFSISEEEIFKEKFIKLFPYSTRPYGKLYAY